MQHDDIIWSVCGGRFCAFRAATDNVILCRNAFNVTGECLRETCPLANSYYGTIIEQEGVCYLYLKTIERAHTPRKLWEKIKLKDDETKALQQIESHMKNVYKDSQIENCQRRLLKIREYLQRMRKMALQPALALETEDRSLTLREARREVGALRAAQISRHVETELVNRLKSGHYGDIYNYPQQEFTQRIENIETESDNDDGEYIEVGEEELTDADYGVENIEDLECA